MASARACLDTHVPHTLLHTCLHACVATFPHTCLSTSSSSENLLCAPHAHSCMHACTRVCINAFAHVYSCNPYAGRYAGADMCTCLCASMRKGIRTGMRKGTCVRMYAWTCTCLHTCLCTCICTCAYTCPCTCLHPSFRQHRVLIDVRVHTHVRMLWAGGFTPSSGSYTVS